MKTKLLYLLAVLFLFAGCSESMEEDPAPEKRYLLQRKLSEITFSSGGGMTMDLTYTYNSFDQLSQISGLLIRDTIELTDNTTLAYDEQGRLAHIQDNEGTTWSNVYDEEGKLIKLVKVSGDSAPFSYLYFYDEKNQLQEVKTYRRQDGAEVAVGNILYTHSNETQINIIYNVVSGEKRREYNVWTDNKKRELPVLPNQIAHDFNFSELTNEGLISSHNIIRSEMVYSTLRISGHDYECHYTYNEGGYPATCMKLFEDGSLEKITYTYAVL